MKHRASGNPLSNYRRIQRQIREIFDPFTAKHCPSCTTPCCIKPTRVVPFDVALAEGTGHTWPHLNNTDPYAAALEHASGRLIHGAIGLTMAPIDSDVSEPCEYLDQGRCSFPNDLRPFGCTTYICDPMYKNLPDDEIRKLRRLTRDLEQAHVYLLRALRNSGRAVDIEDD